MRLGCNPADRENAIWLRQLARGDFNEDDVVTLPPFLPKFNGGTPNTHLSAVHASQHDSYFQHRCMLCPRHHSSLFSQSCPRFMVCRQSYRSWQPLRNPTFTHGQLYVALSRGRSASSIKCIIDPRNTTPHTKQKGCLQRSCPLIELLSICSSGPFLFLLFPVWQTNCYVDIRIERHVFNSSPVLYIWLWNV